VFLAFSPALAAGVQARPLSGTGAGAIQFRQFAYAAVADLDTYNIIVSDGAGSEKRVAEVNIDGIGFSDVTARLSPSGTTVAFRVTGDRSGGSQLQVLDIASGKTTLVSQARSTAEGISTYRWSPVGTTLAFVRISPAPYPQNIEDRYGRVYIYANGQANPLPGSRGNDRLLGFSGDGRGVYVSRIESAFNSNLEHLVYLPLTGGDATTLIKSTPGLRYSQFSVWAKPGSPAKVAALAEGDFSLAVPRSPKSAPTSTPEGTGDGPISILQIEPDLTVLAATPIPTETATVEPTPTWTPQPSSTQVTGPATPDPLNRVFVDDTPLATVTGTPETAPTEEATATPR
jgi:dipeptidyl aminopeptidase/acylaminoacyl peptidase